MCLNAHAHVLHQEYLAFSRHNPLVNHEHWRVPWPELMPRTSKFSGDSHAEIAATTSTLEHDTASEEEY